MFGFFLIFSPMSFAYEPAGATVSIDKVIQWGNNEDFIFTTSSGHACFVPQAEKSLISIVLLMKSTGKTAELYCEDNNVDYGGQLAGKVYRLTMN